MMGRGLIVLLVLAGVASSPADAQGRFAVGLDHAVYAGWPSSSVTWLRLERVAFDGAWPLRGGSGWLLAYAAAGFPLVAARGNFLSDRRSPGGRQTTQLGLGIHPLGLRVLRSIGGGAIHLGLTGGYMYFGKPVPTAASTQGNFSVEAEAGFRVPLTRSREIVLAYHINHMSNAGRGRLNLGVDSHLVRLAIGSRE